MAKILRGLTGDKRGVSALEYSILAALVVLGVVAGVNTTGLQNAMNTVFTDVTTEINKRPTAAAPTN